MCTKKRTASLKLCIQIVSESAVSFSEVENDDVNQYYPSNINSLKVVATRCNRCKKH